MPSPVGFEVEQYFQEFASKSAMAEAARFKTIATGQYMAQATDVKGRYFELLANSWKYCSTSKPTGLGIVRHSLIND